MDLPSIDYLVVVRYVSKLPLQQISIYARDRRVFLVGQFFME